MDSTIQPVHQARELYPSRLLPQTTDYIANSNPELDIQPNTGLEDDPANVKNKTIGKRYKPVSLIKSGGMAHVYRATDMQEGKDCALKIMKVLGTGAYDTRLLKRFAREGTTMQKLEHPNILSIYSSGEDNGVQYIAMELTEGGTLGSRKDTLTLKEKLLIIADICDALNYVHNQDVIHRDLKPDNILLSNETTNTRYPSHPKAKLADFGLNLDKNESRISQSGDLAGTAYYMAPEDKKNKLSDLYSTGVILYELTTGRVPFGGNDLFSIIAKHQTEKPIPPNIRIEQSNKANQSTTTPKISANLETLIMFLLEKIPDRRTFRSANEVATELRNIASPKLRSAIRLPILSL